MEAQAKKNGFPIKQKCIIANAFFYRTILCPKIIDNMCLGYKFNYCKKN